MEQIQKRVSIHVLLLAREVNTFWYTVYQTLHHYVMNITPVEHGYVIHTVDWADDVLEEVATTLRNQGLSVILECETPGYHLCGYKVTPCDNYFPVAIQQRLNSKQEENA